MDVWVRVQLRHPRTSDLEITLTNPAGTEISVFSSTTAGVDLDLDLPLTGFSGDEQVNGVWSLEVVDRRADRDPRSRRADGRQSLGLTPSTARHWTGSNAPPPSPA